MRAVTLCAVAALLMMSVSANPTFVSNFEAFKTKYNRKYASAAEEAHRFKIFAENMRKAAELQLVNPKAKFGVNEFADMSAAEFKTRHNGNRFYKHAQKHANKLDTLHFTAEQKKAAAGKSSDWRPKGAVTAVKNQGQCGSCWSFSTTGGIEGQWFLAGNTLTSLSEQELVSCDTIDQGCNGGLMDNAMTWLLQTHNGSIVTEASYPYVSGGGAVPACSMTGTQFGAQIESFKNIAKNEDDMAAFVYASGPLSIAVYAEPWQSYTGGILTNCPQDQLDHGVLIVGYDDNNNPPYWIIKNSWGPSWGENGYIRVEKGTGQCNIGTYQTTSIIKKSSPTPAPGPGPAPSSSEFVQKTCTDAECKHCEEMRFPQNKCISRDHASYIAQCGSNALIIQEFDSKDCSGVARWQTQPLDLCAIVFGTFDSEEFVGVSCKVSPSPTSAPTAAPTPAPTPASATFTQTTCTDSACSQNCQSQTFAQNTCLQLTSGGSATAACTSSSLNLTVYPDSTDCTGASEVVPQPINTCTQDNAGTYFEDTCSTGKIDAVLATKGLTMRK